MSGKSVLPARRILQFVVLCAALTIARAGAPQRSGPVDRQGTFVENVLSVLSVSPGQRRAYCEDLLEANPVEWDWLCQDTGEGIAEFITAERPVEMLRQAVERVRAEPGPRQNKPKTDRLQTGSGNLRALLQSYVELCRRRRQQRLRNIRRAWGALVFVKNVEHGNAPRGPMSLSNGPYKGQPFSPGSAICLLDLSQSYGHVEKLLEDRGGMLRDPDVSFDGKRILFSWKKSARGDDYHLYEMTLEDRGIRQITGEPGVADVQGRYVPGGIVYHSSRCVNVVVCNETIDTVNMYRCDLDGRNVRRLSYDQVSTQYPSVLADGRIIYTRWEYNDRGQIFPQGLFVMNPDGTGQLAVYGNNSWYPTSLIQARGIPGSTKLLVVLSGHHTPPCGKLALVDVNGGQDEGHGITLVAPRRPVRYERLDKAGQDDVLFQHPYPLNEDEYVVGFSICGRKKSRDFGIYYMRSDGARELLAWDPELTCRQPVPLAARPMPRLRPALADANETTGVFYVNNVYEGQGLRGIEKGTIKRLRVIGLDFRAAAVGISFNNGPAGSARLDTPVSIGGTWDTKIVLGDAEVYEDGSASFIVPARMPVYFQAIDAEGRAVQSMRSWATLQGGEKLSCIGCHAKRNRAPNAAARKTIAQLKGPQELKGFYGPARGFSFLREVQPILDRHCVGCHRRPYRPPVIDGRVGGIERLYCYWPAQYSRTLLKRALYHLPKQETVGSVSIRWLEGAKGIRAPSRWELFYQDGEDWKKLDVRGSAAKGTLREPVATSRLMVEAVMPGGSAGGIAEWRVYDRQGRELGGQASGETFSLLPRKVYEELSGRAWAESYLSLVRAEFRRQGSIGYHLAAYPNECTHWISPQSGPAVLAPYSFGAARSGLITMLRAGHEGVKLSREEMDKLACWLDLGVPYCGEYTEANIWTEADMRFYSAQMALRRRLAESEIR